MHHQKGFSLIETLVVLAISALLCCFSISFFQDYFAKQQARWYLLGIKQLMIHATQYASLCHQTMIICPIGKHDYCGKNWAKGQVLFIAPDTSFPFYYGSGIIREHKNTRKHHRISLKSFPSSKYLRFDGQNPSNHNNGRFIYSLANHSLTLQFKQNGYMSLA